MFNFKRLLIIFKTNWKNVINETLPKGNSSLFSQTNIDDAFTGIILIVISSLFYCIFNINVIPLVISIIRLILCGVLFCILNKYREKSINTIIVFILFVIASLNMLASFIASVIYLPILFIKFNVILFILNLVESVGFAFLVVTFIEFLNNAKNIYDKEHYVEKKEDIKLKTIDINDISMHATAMCDNCNYQVSKSDMFCSNCGKKLK